MATKSIHTLTQEECKKYYTFLQENASEQWDIAETLSKNGKYGAATSHLLISIEELIKSIVIFMDAQGYNFRSVKGIDTIFNNHRIRFFIAYFMFVISIFGDDATKWLKKVKGKPEIIKAQLKLIASKDEFPFSVKFYILKKIIRLKAEMKFFEKADVIRQLGFYADFNDQVESPQVMTAELYKEIYDRMSKIRSLAGGFIDAYTPGDPEMDKMLEENKKFFADGNYYKLIEDGFLKVKKTKNSAFDLLK